MEVNISLNIDEFNLTDESVKVIQWHGFFSILLIILCTTCALISTCGKSMIIYFILYKAPRRPLNTMILLDQVLLFLTSLVAEIMIIGSLATSTPILNILGETACDVFYLSISTFNGMMVIDGLSMAIFRLFCVKYQAYLTISLENLVSILLWIQYGVGAFLISTFYYSVNLFGTSNLYEFSRGYTRTVWFEMGRAFSSLFC